MTESDPKKTESKIENKTEKISRKPELLSEDDDTNLGAFAHLGGIMMFVPSLFIWMFLREKGKFTEVEAKEALNFQITLVFLSIAIWVIKPFSGFLFPPLSVPSTSTFVTWFPWILSVIFSIIGFQKARTSEHYRYPFTLRLIK